MCTSVTGRRSLRIREAAEVYTVATENLGEKPGLLAAAALMIDYILTAAVGISAGVTALTSAVPSLQPHTLLICLVILVMLAIVNLRGVKDTGGVHSANVSICWARC